MEVSSTNQSQTPSQETTTVIGHSQERPTLGSFLRTNYLKRNLDIDEATLNQTQALKRRKVKSSLISKNSFSFDSSSSASSFGDEFTFKNFFAKAISDCGDAKQVEDMRKLFQRFLKQIIELLGGDENLSTKDLHAEAFQLFQSLESKHVSIEQKKESFSKQFKVESLKQYFDKLIETIKTLSEWRLKYLFPKEDGQEEDEEGSGSEEEAAQQKQNAVAEIEKEFGDKFDFVFTTSALVEPTVSDISSLTRGNNSITSDSSTDENFEIPPDTQQQQQHQPQQSFWKQVSQGLKFDDHWLLRICELYSESQEQDQSPIELATLIYNELKSTQPSDTIAANLVDLLGINSMDLIPILMSKRKSIISMSLKKIKEASGGFKSGESQELEKLIRSQNQQQQKNKKVAIGLETTSNSGKGSVGPSTLSIDVAALKDSRIKSLSSGATLSSGHTVLPTAPSFATKLALPEGSTRRDTDSYEEVKIPFSKPKPLNPNETLVPITEFEDWAQTAFPGVKHLNRIQSKLYEAAYKSNENILLCAPTGAGKTNVAMMAILHEIGQHFVGGLIRKENFKMVYVAPMKALAAEVAMGFGKRLAPLGIICRELTGDMQLSKKELAETQIIVTTPEKWDVITRKSGDNPLSSLVKLLIIDEVHLLNEDRGPVIEVLVARTLRQVETSQSMIRIVGLSATLPNYADVAHFLRVSEKGLFFFDNSYRPVPLSQQYIGVKESNPMRAKTIMNDICFEKVLESVKAGHQVMVFVHSRKDTAKTAQQLVDMAKEAALVDWFSLQDDPSYFQISKEVMKSRNKPIKELFPFGFSTHHAGMLVSDRRMVERLFGEGMIKVLCCTSTLAWGVNLPAHTVIIKGTQVYDSKHGKFIELGMLDVMQIFGRAGRPQFDTSGEGIILTQHEHLANYLKLMNHQLPIESQFISALADHLNAEIVLGTVTNIQEAVNWISYTYLYIRMLKNPLAYGLTYSDKQQDNLLVRRRRELIITAAKSLDDSRMIRFAEHSETFSATDLGRISSHYYVRQETIQTFNELLGPQLTQPDIFSLVSRSSEFENIMMREEEMGELETLEQVACKVPVKGGLNNREGKVNVLLQSFLSNSMIDGFALVTDSAYIAQNAQRIFRALFEIVLKRNWISLSAEMLLLCKMMERRIWNHQHPLRQFTRIPLQIIYKLEEKHADIEKLSEMDSGEVASLIHNNKGNAEMVLGYVRQIPHLNLNATIQPITRNILRVKLTIKSDFDWNDKHHGSVEPFWFWMCDADNEQIIHSEYFLLYKKNRTEQQELIFTVPIFEPLPNQYFLHCYSDRWLGSEQVLPISFKHLILPFQHPPQTELLDLRPLPVTALHNPEWEKIFNRFSHFNPIQTQLFHTMYHTDHNVLLGAPTGSGKTIVSELAIFKLFRDRPGSKVVYIGPLKALVRERLKDWTEKFQKKLGKKVVELTGDYTPNLKALMDSDIVCTTPEKWDGISRSWQQRSYVTSVGLVIFDEIHLLGEERGPVLEAIVSRMRYISSQVDSSVRMVGLSTALANARDMADWMGIGRVGLFNFKPAVRPVPMEAFIQGYAGKHYCPRMATMNKPAYQAIMTHSPTKPVIIFVSSRRQTRLTAIDLMSYLAADSQPHKFLRMSDSELKSVLEKVDDASLRDTLQFGIAMHHAGLPEDQKALVEDLFEANKIQVLVSTSTLAWGVNLPAHLVIIKGTEFFDPKTKRYVDMPITEILQMCGRAGRPQFDTSAKAVIMVEESKKNFYKKFLYDPFPVESSLGGVLHNHINAEIVAGTIQSKQDAVDYLSWTFYFRRLLINPTYYGLASTKPEELNKFLSGKVESVIEDLTRAGCVGIGEDDLEVFPQTIGRIASYYYLDYKTADFFKQKLNGQLELMELLNVLSQVTEYDEVPVRHNEEKLNELLAKQLGVTDLKNPNWEDPHIKAQLLLRAHLDHADLPISDFVTDTKSVLDQALRILQAMIDVCADSGWLFTALNAMQLVQMIVQARWRQDSSLLVLPHFNRKLISTLKINSLAEICNVYWSGGEPKLRQVLPSFSERHFKDVAKVLSLMPSIDVKFKLNVGNNNNNSKNNSNKQQQQQQQSKTEGSIQVELLRNAPAPSNGVYAPHFPKQKDESWWLVLGDPQHSELIALKRIMFIGKQSNTTLTFDLPEKQGQYTYQLYLISDSYLGLDQQYSIDFKI